MSEERAVYDAESVRVILSADDRPAPESVRRLWLTRRQAIIMELGAIEDYLDMPRSIVPRRKREQGCRGDERQAS